MITRRQVTVATLNERDAAYWQGLLESRGIPTHLVGTERSAAAGGMLYVELRVSGEEADHAEALVKARRSTDSSGVGRAWTTAFVGIGIPPIQLYSVYLVARLLPGWRGLSVGERRRVAQAVVLNLWLPLMVTAYVLSAVS